MDLSIYLAVTGAELRGLDSRGRSLAWMACRFSQSGTGISGAPTSLPPKSILMLTDEIPAQDHEPGRIAAEMIQAAQALDCSRILLDFQRPNDPKTTEISAAIIKASPIPVGISALYAHQFDCPVLVSPSPIWHSLDHYIAPWHGREIWLEAILEDALVTVTDTGSQYSLCNAIGSYPLFHEGLCVSYRTEVTANAIHFFLHRGKEELDKLLEKANAHDITTAIGLYQQLGI